MKLELLVNNVDAISRIGLLELRNKQLAWDFADNIDVVDGHLKKYSEARNDIIKKYGTPLEDNPENFEIKTGDLKFKKYEEEVKALLEVDVKIVFKKLKLSDLKDSKVSVDTMRSWRELNILTKK